MDKGWDKDWIQSECSIRNATKEDWESAMALAWKTYLQFEAPDFPTEGTTSFFAFITDNFLFTMFVKGEYRMKVAIYKKQIIGMISIREKTHISLLFVDRTYHKRGVGRALVEQMYILIQEEKLGEKMTVNAAPFAVDFYHKCGFNDSGEKRTDKGIIFIPMERRFP